MKNLVFENIITAVLVILAAFALLLFILKLLAQWIVKNHRPDYLDLQTDKPLDIKTKKAFKKSGLREFQINTKEMGFVSSWGKNRKDAISRVEAKGLTLKYLSNAK